MEGQPTTVSLERILGGGGQPLCRSVHARQPQSGNTLRFITSTNLIVLLYAWSWTPPHHNRTWGDSDPWRCIQVSRMIASEVRSDTSCSERCFSLYCFVEQYIYIYKNIKKIKKIENDKGWKVQVVCICVNARSIELKVLLRNREVALFSVLMPEKPCRPERSRAQIWTILGLPFNFSCVGR